MAKKLKAEAETDDSIYEVGQGVQLLSFDIVASMGSSDPLEVIKLYKRHKVGFYFVSTLVHACLMDGILGRRERIFLDKARKFLGVSNAEYAECLKGCDCSIELYVAWMAVYLRLHPNATKIEFKKAIQNWKRQFILMCIIGATQDGIIEDKTYVNVKRIAFNIAVTDTEMKKCIEIARLHIEMARKLKHLLD